MRSIACSSPIRWRISRAGEAPDPVGLSLVPAGEAPARLISIELGLGEDALTERLIGQCEHAGQSIDLIPLGLRGDGEPFALHRPALPLERQVIEIPADRQVDGEGRGVAASGDQLRGFRCHYHRGVAGAPVLLAQVSREHEVALDDGDLFAELVLIVPVLELAGARGASTLWLSQLMGDIDERQLVLLAGPAAFLGRALARRSVRTAAVLRGRPEKGRSH